MMSAIKMPQRIVQALGVALFPCLVLPGHGAAASESREPQSAQQVWQEFRGSWSGSGRFTITGPGFRHQGEYVATARFLEEAFCSGFETASDSGGFCSEVGFTGPFQFEIAESPQGYGFCYEGRCAYRARFDELFLEEDIFLDGHELVKTGRKLTQEGYFVEWTERLEK